MPVCSTYRSYGTAWPTDPPGLFRLAAASTAASALMKHAMLIELGRTARDAPKE